MPASHSQSPEPVNIYVAYMVNGALQVRFGEVPELRRLTLDDPVAQCYGRSP